MQLASLGDGIVLGCLIGMFDMLVVLIYSRMIWNKMVPIRPWLYWPNMLVVVFTLVASYKMLTGELNQVVPFQPQWARNARNVAAIFWCASFLAFLITVIRRNKASSR
jgi:hypothetical protein